MVNTATCVNNASCNHAGLSITEAAMDGLFDAYVQLLEPTIAWVRATPRDAQTSERAYDSATRAKAFDLLRGLLPMATVPTWASLPMGAPLNT
jgi:hypothetical protein